MGHHAPHFVHTSVVLCCYCSENNNYWHVIKLNLYLILFSLIWPKTRLKFCIHLLFCAVIAVKIVINILLNYIYILLILEPHMKRMKIYEYSSDSDSDDDKPLIPRTTSDALLHYRDEPKADMDSCPLEWWKVNAGSHTVLATVARKYLASPATSVPCEWLFSHSGNILNKKRSSLSTENVDKLVCLNNWLQL